MDYEDFPPALTHATKRKGGNSIMHVDRNSGDGSNASVEHNNLGQLVVFIRQKLAKEAAPETIQLCGRAPLLILADHPEMVAELALEYIHSHPHHSVPVQWRRLYEDACLYQAAKVLQRQIDSGSEQDCVNKRRKTDGTLVASSRGQQDWLDDLVRILDRGIAISGSPGRRPLFNAIFQRLEDVIGGDEESSLSNTFNISPPKSLSSHHPIPRSSTHLDITEFQNWLTTKPSTPLIIPNITSSWPASTRWHNPNYLLKQTLSGRRLVPIELGESYTSPDFSQKFLTMREYILNYLLPSHPSTTGYLAQHDLFAQIPSLKDDILVPDLVYATPAPLDAFAQRTAGLADAKEVDEPLMNAWLGPKGTKSPLHTDPYHNILCQVVGWKYVRLYSPAQTPKLYPRGVDEKGIDMSNTSQIDVSLFRASGVSGGDLDRNAVEETAKEKFPEFASAEYIESVLGPGEGLYIPLGWWHYVESVTVSFSVSFWWN